MALSSRRLSGNSVWKIDFALGQPGFDPANFTSLALCSISPRMNAAN
jgi:hypothetical protein